MNKDYMIVKGHRQELRASLAKNLIIEHTVYTKDAGGY